ncbi:mechanosensitive ion channel family protein [Planococcus antarcticus DSM 14505]|uniref:Mechanosensitive ion channel family protein n=1 Tax=Planococcus antarcticus DSM 14505 TaxID=1185653 RepID=A0A1C7DDA3_9BACL|nr:mechanosensitive ion channel family protein [Planococcus antarcticus]ANU09372.1 mechanosensitive ion channel protein MscS [Planococcus antarcticus DSM 14505]EIM06022.1 mechanosensitive ion channel family protein [Planococcus antarcticus DSM 14505]
MNVEKITQRILDVISNEAMWIDLAVIFLKVILITIAAVVAVKVLRVLIRKTFSVRIKGPLLYNERRQQTLSKLLSNVVAYVVYFIAGVSILSTFTIDITGLIAGAGVLGLAIGFGAQNLVRDVITGFFIIFEDQFSVGDYVRIGAAEGTVEEIGLRTTKVKAWTGELFIFPNGTITDVVNFSIHNSIAVVDVNISYESDITRVESLIMEFLDSLQDRYEQIIKPAELLGVQNLTTTEIVMRITAETLPMQHFAIAREMRRDLKDFLDQRGVEIPYPRMVMMQRSPEEMATAKNAKT